MVIKCLFLLQIAELEKQLEQQEKLKEEQLETWRKEKDTLLGALEGELKRLRDKSQKATEALADKEKYIEQLKKEMLDKMSQSAAFTEDEESEEDKRSTRRSTRTSRKSRSSRTSKPDMSETSVEESDYGDPVKTRRSRRVQLQPVKEEPILIEDSPVVNKEADVAKGESPVAKEVLSPNSKQKQIDQEVCITISVHHPSVLTILSVFSSFPIG